MAQHLFSGDEKSRQAQADAVNRVLGHLPDQERYVIANRYYASAGFETIAEWMEGEVTPTEVEEFSERGLSLLADLDESDLAVYAAV